MKASTSRGLAALVVAGCSFLLGRLSSALWNVMTTPQNYSSISVVDAVGSQTVDGSRFVTVAESIHRETVRGISSLYSSSLDEQIQDQGYVQTLIHENQNPGNCELARYLVRDAIPPKDGFASEIMYISRLLQAATSTRRTLWISKDWTSAYAPADCVGEAKETAGNSARGWTCLWEAVTNCTTLPSKKKKRARAATSPNNQTGTTTGTIENPLTFGIIPRKLRNEDNANSNPWFDPMPYGSRQILPAPISFPLKHLTMMMDVLPHWERRYGRYWVRSQMVHYLWRPSPFLQQEMQQRRLALDHDVLYIGMHIRLTDNIPDFAKSFGRNATWTRRLERFMEIAEHIRQETRPKQPEISTIYIATDHAEVLSWARRDFAKNHRWTFVGLPAAQVQRSTTQQRVWFSKGRSMAAGAMAADLDMLRKADYLIGSFQSNVFRLAAQLNTAWHVAKYSVHQQRHFTVDVEWFEDP
jgi:hypothetical protein